MWKNGQVGKMDECVLEKWFGEGEYQVIIVKPKDYGCVWAWSMMGV